MNGMHEYECSYEYSSIAFIHSLSFCHDKGIEYLYKIFYNYYDSRLLVIIAHYYESQVLQVIIMILILLLMEGVVRFFF